jgi:hypothetical protein
VLWQLAVSVLDAVVVAPGATVAGVTLPLLNVTLGAAQAVGELADDGDGDGEEDGDGDEVGGGVPPASG